MHGSPKPIGLIDSPSGGHASRFPGEWAAGVMDELFQNCDHLRPAPARHWSESQYVGQPDTVDGESDSGGAPWGNTVPVEPGLPIGIAFTQGLQFLGTISVGTGDILLAVSFFAPWGTWALSWWLVNLWLMLMPVGLFLTSRLFCRGTASP